MSDITIRDIKSLGLQPKEKKWINSITVEITKVNALRGEVKASYTVKDVDGDDTTYLSSYKYVNFKIGDVVTISGRGGISANGYTSKNGNTEVSLQAGDKSVWTLANNIDVAQNKIASKQTSQTPVTQTKTQQDSFEELTSKLLNAQRWAHGYANVIKDEFPDAEVGAVAGQICKQLFDTGVWKTAPIYNGFDKPKAKPAVKQVKKEESSEEELDEDVPF